jgi:hypothetical protein
MNRIVSTLLIAGAMGVGMQAMADDASSSSSSSSDQIKAKVDHPNDNSAPVTPAH